MRYFDYGKNCMCQLKEVDYKDPFFFLNHIFKDADSAEQIQEECWEIFTLAFKPYLWMTYESPLIIYKKFKQMIRLLELGSLISTIRPNNYAIKGQMLASFPCVDHSSLNGNERIQATYKSLIAFYTDDELHFYRMDLFHILLVGFNHNSEQDDSCMGEILYHRFKEINEIINCLFIIHLHEKEHRLSTRDKNVLLCSQDNGNKIKRPYLYGYDIDSIIGQAVSKNELLDVLKSAHGVLYYNNYWKSHGNPGAVLVRFQYFRDIIETFYFHFMTISEADFMIDVDWPIPKKNQQELNRIANAEVRNPWRYIEHKFNEKPLSYWLKQLEEWEEAVLSNKEYGHSFIKRINAVKTFLETLIVIADLMIYEPLYEEHDDAF